MVFTSNEHDLENEMIQIVGWQCPFTDDELNAIQRENDFWKEQTKEQPQERKFCFRCWKWLDEGLFYEMKPSVEWGKTSTQYQLYLCDTCYNRAIDLKFHLRTRVAYTLWYNRRVMNYTRFKTWCGVQKIYLHNWGVRVHTQWYVFTQKAKKWWYKRFISPIVDFRIVWRDDPKLWMRYLQTIKKLKKLSPFYYIILEIKKQRIRWELSQATYFERPILFARYVKMFPELFTRKP